MKKHSLDPGSRSANASRGWDDSGARRA